MFSRIVTLTLLVQVLPAALPAAGSPVVGRVFGPDGESRSKAEVCLEPTPPTPGRTRWNVPGPASGRTSRFAADVSSTVGTRCIRDDAWRPQLRFAAAGEDGFARLPLGRGETIRLEVLADGHLLVVYDLFDEASVTIEVPAGVAGTVRVTDRPWSSRRALSYLSA